MATFLKSIQSTTHQPVPAKQEKSGKVLSKEEEKVHEKDEGAGEEKDNEEQEDEGYEKAILSGHSFWLTSLVVSSCDTITGC